MRYYDEPVDVRVQPAGPVAFLWRDRLYVVREVLGRWRERDAWWRREDLRLRDGAERRVWRVEAGRGRAAGVGVFDLVEDVPMSGQVSGSVSDPHVTVDPSPAVPPDGAWRLLRAAD